MATALDQLLESYALATKQPPPPGRILVHNRVRPTARLGSRGFRAYWARPGAEFVLCDCGWRPDLGEHYVVAALDAEGDTRPGAGRWWRPA